MGNNHSSAPASDAIPVGVPVGVDAGKPTASGTKKLDLVFTMDCTGSMGSYISAAKNNIETICARLTQVEGYDLRFGLIAYRDHPPQDSSFVTKTFPFTASLATMKQQLGLLSASGGGDGPEAVAAALNATLESSWREDATKVCILIADAPPHGLGERGDGFPNGAPDGVDPLVVLDGMSAKGITIYAVGCMPALSNYQYAIEFFIAAAQRTNGQAVALGSAAALAEVITGGAIEEMDLESLSASVASHVQQLRAAEPALADEEVQQRIWSTLQSRGARTRQVKTSMLQSAHAHLVSQAPSLCKAREALCAAGPLRESHPMARTKLRALPGSPAKKCRGVYRSSRGAPPPLPCAAAGCPPPLAAARMAAPSLGSIDCEFGSGPATASVEIAEDAVSYEQVARMYGKGKKKGLW